MELKKCKLSDVATVEISNVDKKTKDGESSVKLCNFTDVYYNWAVTNEMVDNFMSASASDKQIERFSLKKGQVALTKDSETRYDIGIPTYIADDFDNVILGYHCALITPDESKISGKFLNAFMNSPYIHKYFANSASGSGQRYALSSEALECMPLLLPSLEDQKQIGNIFSDIDRKISLNRAINKNLEALAKQIYDYWFVQFDFPDENGRPYKSSGGKMVWNEKLKREIPIDWEVVKLSDYLKVYIDKISPTDVKEDDRYAPIEVIPRHKMSFCEFAPIENAVSGLCRFKRRHILLSNRRVYFHKVCIAAFDGLTRDTVIILEPLSGNNLAYSYQLVNDDVFIEYATRNSYGSEQPVFSWEGARNYNVLKPSDNLDIRYSDFINPIIEGVLRNEVEIETLIKLRNELLPLLMNGQVKI